MLCDCTLVFWLGINEIRFSGFGSVRLADGCCGVRGFGLVLVEVSVCLMSWEGG